MQLGEAAIVPGGSRDFDDSCERCGYGSIRSCSGFGRSGRSVIVASLSNSTPATDTAFSSAIRTTFVGSMMPASTRSQ